MTLDYSSLTCFDLPKNPEIFILIIRNKITLCSLHNVLVFIESRLQQKLYISEIYCKVEDWTEFILLVFQNILSGLKH